MKAFVGFAGFGGVDLALREAGYQVTGLEIDNEIANVNRLNGGHCLTGDILDIDPADYMMVNLAHFSPPCPNFSLAKYENQESGLDLALANKISDFVRISRPQYFTLENVWGYRRSESWGLILAALQENGYGVDWWNLNAADYGVPQTRKRMIVIARRDGLMPPRPWPTHSKNPDMFTELWIGWYEAIEDLIPSLPASKFAPWQLGKVEQSTAEIWPTEAAIVNGQNQGHLLSIRECTQPIFTICNAAKGTPKAILVDPAFTIEAQPNRLYTRALLDSGRIVSMTPRALARFQDLPDWFQLPEKRGLACKGIGNAVPPALYRAVLKSLK